MYRLLRLTLLIATIPAIAQLTGCAVAVGAGREPREAGLGAVADGFGIPASLWVALIVGLIALLMLFAVPAHPERLAAAATSITTINCVARKMPYSISFDQAVDSKQNT